MFLLRLLVLETSKDIHGVTEWVDVIYNNIWSIYRRMHSSAASVEYWVEYQNPTKFHYPVTEKNSYCSILLIPSDRIGSDESQFCLPSDWPGLGLNLQFSFAREFSQSCYESDYLSASLTVEPYQYLDGWPPRNLTWFSNPDSYRLMAYLIRNR